MAFEVKKDFDGEYGISWCTVGSTIYAATETKVYTSSDGVNFVAIRAEAKETIQELFVLNGKVYVILYSSVYQSLRIFELGPPKTWTEKTFQFQYFYCYDVKVRLGKAYMVFAGTDGRRKYCVAVFDGKTISFIKQVSGLYLSIFGVEVDSSGNVYYSVRDITALNSYKNTVYKYDSQNHIPLFDFPQTRWAYGMCFYNNELHFLTHYDNLSKRGISKYDGNGEVVLVDGTIDIKSPTGSNWGGLEEGRLYDMTVADDKLWFCNKYAASSDPVNNQRVYNWDGTTLTLFDEFDRVSYFGNFFASETELILGTKDKFVYITIEVPAPDPPPPPPEQDIEVTQSIDIVVKQCTDENAVMLCWLNSLGGWDQWLFEDVNTNFEKALSSKTDQVFTRYVEKLDQVQSVEDILSKTNERSMTVGTQGISEDQLEGLLDLVASPKVLMLVSSPEVRPPQWMGVTLKDGNVKYSKGQRDLELTIQLPDYLTQRA